MLCQKISGQTGLTIGHFPTSNSGTRLNLLIKYFSLVPELKVGLTELTIAIGHFPTSSSGTRLNLVIKFQSDSRPQGWTD